MSIIEEKPSFDNTLCFSGEKLFPEPYTQSMVFYYNQKTPQFKESLIILNLLLLRYCFYILMRTFFSLSFYNLFLNSLLMFMILSILQPPFGTICFTNMTPLTISSSRMSKSYIATSKK